MSGGAWVALGVAVVATQCWRVLAAAAGPHIARSRRATAAIDGMACALVAGLVSGMVVDPGGALAAAPVGVRIAALAVALITYFSCGRSVPAGVSAGFATIVAGAALV